MVSGPVENVGAAQKRVRQVFGTGCSSWSALRYWCGVALFLFSTLAAAEQFAGTVVSVSDGDTITVLDAANRQHRVRLAGIDAPEKRQPFGRASKEHLADFVYKRHVSVEWHKLDKYGRVVGKVFLEGKDVCLEQISAGLAWHYKKYEQEQMPEDRGIYSRMEELARSRSLGLWKDRAPTPPWEWRARARAR